MHSLRATLEKKQKPDSLLHKRAHNRNLNRARQQGCQYRPMQVSNHLFRTTCYTLHSEFFYQSNVAQNVHRINSSFI